MPTRQWPMGSALPRQALQSASQQNTCSLHVDRTNHLSLTSGQEKPPVLYTYWTGQTNQEEVERTTVVLWKQRTLLVPLVLVCYFETQGVLFYLSVLVFRVHA